MNHEVLDYLFEDKKFVFIDALVEETPEADKKNLVKNLVVLAESIGYQSSLALLKHFIKREFDEIAHPNTLFRGNSVASKFLTVYSHLIGDNYLQKVLKEPLAKIIEANSSFEINPHSGLYKAKEASRNMKNLKNSCQEILNNIMKSFEKSPLVFNHIAKFIKEEVGVDFPDHQYTVIGSWLFLRFYCPAIVFPKDFKLYRGEVSDASKRGLVLISKVLQNLSNGITYGDKEKFMIDLNPFILKNQTPLLNYYKKMATTSRKKSHHKIKSKVMSDSRQDKSFYMLKHYLKLAPLKVDPSYESQLMKMRRILDRDSEEDSFDSEDLSWSSEEEESEEENKVHKLKSHEKKLVDTIKFETRSEHEKEVARNALFDMDTVSNSLSLAVFDLEKTEDQRRNKKQKMKKRQEWKDRQKNKMDEITTEVLAEE